MTGQEVSWGGGRDRREAVGVDRWVVMERNANTIANNQSDRLACLHQRNVGHGSFHGVLYITHRGKSHEASVLWWRWRIGENITIGKALLILT